MRRENAFTLVELLVVIAIISILAAMLLPALESARFSAQVVACGNHLRQWSIAFSSYAMDHAGCFPRQDITSASFGRNQWAVHKTFFEIMQQDYEMPFELFHCAIDAKMDESWYSGPYSMDYVTYYESIGGLNLLGWCYWVPRKGGATPLVPDAVAAPVRMTDTENTDRPVLTDRYQEYAGEPREFNPHMLGGTLVNLNHLYHDGHVRTVRGGEVELRSNWHLDVYY